MRFIALACCFISPALSCAAGESAAPRATTFAELAREFEEATDSKTRCAAIGPVNSFAQAKIKAHRDGALVYDRNFRPATGPPFDMNTYSRMVSNDAELKDALLLLVTGISHDDGPTAVASAHAMLNFCQNAKAPISSRFDSLQNPTLSLVGDDVLPLIVSSFTSSEADVRRCAAEILVCFDAIPADAKKALKKATGDSDSSVRSAAVSALEHFDKRGGANKAIDNDKK
jgi:hypothetical protein